MIQAHRLFTSLALTMIVLSASLVSAPRASAEQVYIGLRNGPSEAFPVIYEVTPRRHLEVIYRRGSWVKATDGRSSGWLHVDDLHLLETFPRDELWKLVNDARPGRVRPEFVLSSLDAYAVGVVFPLFSQDLFARYTCGPEGETSWSLTEFGLLNDFARPVDDLVFSWSGALGYGKDQQGSRFWDSETDDPVWVGTAGAEAMWRVDRYFEIGVRGEVATTLNSEMTTHRSASLVWRVRL